MVRLVSFSQKQRPGIFHRRFVKQLLLHWHDGIAGFMFINNYFFKSKDLVLIQMKNRLMQMFFLWL